MPVKDDTYYKIKLALSENVGPITYRDLMRYFSSAQEAVIRLPEFAARGGRRRPIKIAPDSLVDAQLESAQKNQVQIITADSDDYPFMLKQIEDRPPLLFVKGFPSLLQQKAIGIVGSRNSSINGQNMARRMSYELAKNNYVVVSGMARGIDKAAHEGALANENGKGGTVAVVGTGADKFYPKDNEALYNTISACGCIVSELPMGTQPSPSFFPRRNRIISGLSLGVVVIEANSMSGSLITAQCALNQNREVFAVPGSPLDSRSEGPNRLIQDGAHLVTKAEDVLHVLDVDSTRLLMDKVTLAEPLSLFPREEDLEKARKIVLDLLSPEATDVNLIIRTTNIEPRLVNIILVELELAGRIERFVGGKVALVYSNEWGHA